MHLYCEKTTCGQEPEPGGLIDPVGSEDVKRTGVDNFAGEFKSPKPHVNSHLYGVIVGTALQRYQPHQPF